MKDKLLKHFLSRLVLRNRIRGVTIIELLFVAFILSVVIGIFFYAMSMGQFSSVLSSARADLQTEVTRSMGWMVKDIHQAVSWDIAANNPTPSHVKFREVTGWDTVNNTFSFTNYYVDYTYNAAAKTITRKTIGSGGATAGQWTLNYVNAPPFFTIDSSGNVVTLNGNDLRTSKQIVITISGQKQVTATQNTAYTLTEEVQIRNG